MTSKSSTLAKQFEAKVEEAMATLEQLSEADWTKVTEAEGWPVGVTAHHAASALEPVAHMAEGLVAGEVPGGLTGAMLDNMNAEHARDHAHCTKAETIELLQRGAATAASVIRRLSDDDLARSGKVLADVPSMTAEQLIVAGLIEHVDGHFGSIRKAIGAPAFELVLDRVVDAPRARVFEAWTKPEQMTQWFAPRPFTLVIEAIDFRPAGRFRMAMRGPNGEDFPFTGTYRAIVPPAKLVWTGEFVSGPADQISTEVVFDEQGRKTLVHVRQSFNVVTPETEHATKGARQGWTMTLDQLDAFCSISKDTR